MDLDIRYIQDIVPRKTDNCWCLLNKHLYLKVNVKLPRQGASESLIDCINRENIIFQSFSRVQEQSFCFGSVLEVVEVLAITNYKSISLFTRGGTGT